MDFTTFCLGLIAGCFIAVWIIGLVNYGMRKER